MPSSPRPGEEIKPWATSWELMYSRLDVDITDSIEPLKKGDPSSDNEISLISQRTSFWGVIAISVGVLLVRQAIGLMFEFETQVKHTRRSRARVDEEDISTQAVTN